MSAFNQSGQKVSGSQVNIGGVSNTDYRKRIVEEHLDQMAILNGPLFDSLFTAPGFAYHFEQILKMAKGEK